MMKNKLKLLLLFALLLLIPGFTCAEEALDYSRKENWVILPASTASADETEFDVFYIYPTLAATPLKPYMSWKDNPAMQNKTVDFASAQTGIFGKKARVFAPYVRQLEFTRCRRPIVESNWLQTQLKLGIDDTIAAFNYYLENYNNGRPYILFGHSQGSVDLYETIKACPKISAKSGFAAAYLIGLPRKSAAVINAELAPREIRCSEKADDFGVIIGWNTQSPMVTLSLFTVPETFCVNPLTWTQDENPADKSLNSKSVFYDYRLLRNDDRFSVAEHFCGARIDKSKGALIVDLPVRSQYDFKGIMGAGVFHVNDIWLFAGNIAQNASLRVESYKNAQKSETSKP